MYIALTFVFLVEERKNQEKPETIVMFARRKLRKRWKESRYVHKDENREISKRVPICRQRGESGNDGMNLGMFAKRKIGK